MGSKYPMRALRISDVLYTKVCNLAKLDHRSFNSEVAYILERYIQQFESMNGQIPNIAPDPEEEAEQDKN